MTFPRPEPLLHRIARLLVLATLALSLFACAKKHPLAPALGPGAHSPEEAVADLAQALQASDTSAYFALLTDDFQFGFWPGDSSGNPRLGTTWGRTEEAASLGHMLRGGGALAPPFRFGFAFTSVAPLRNGRRPDPDTVHYRAYSAVTAAMLTRDSSAGSDRWLVNGGSILTLVRGDVAVLSDARRQAGGADSTRWYVGDWLDATMPPGYPGAHVRTDLAVTWGWCKTRWLPAASAEPAR